LHQEKIMPLEDFIIAVLCCVEEMWHESPAPSRLRRRGFAPKLSDSEVLTMEIVGEFLGHDTDQKIWKYFRSHWRHWFPALGSRTTFARQAANLWFIKQLLHQQLIRKLGAYSDPIHIIDGFPVPICHFARAHRCQLFRGIAAYGHCATKDETYKGFHGHIIIDWSGTITGLIFTAANVDERISMFDLLNGVNGLLIGDKGYISEEVKTYLSDYMGIDLQTPLRSNMKDDRDPAFVKQLMKVRRLVETVIGQLSEQFHIEKVRARDLWHLTSRSARKVLSHTVGVYLNRKLGREPLQFEGLIAD
jgi:Transposase DDE domain